MWAQKMGSMAPCVFFRIDVSCIASTPMGRDAALCGWLWARGEDLEIGAELRLVFFLELACQENGQRGVPCFFSY